MQKKKNDWNDHYELKLATDKFPKKVDAVDAHKSYRISIHYIQKFHKCENVKQSDLLIFTLSTALKV